MIAMLMMIFTTLAFGLEYNGSVVVDETTHPQLTPYLGATFHTNAAHGNHNSSMPGLLLAGGGLALMGSASYHLVEGYDEFASRRGLRPGTIHLEGMRQTWNGNPDARMRLGVGAAVTVLGVYLSEKARTDERRGGWKSNGAVFRAVRAHEASKVDTEEVDPAPYVPPCRIRVAPSLGVTPEGGGGMIGFSGRL